MNRETKHRHRPRTRIKSESVNVRSFIQQVAPVVLNLTARGGEGGKGLLSKLMADPSNDGPGVKLMDRATIRLQEGDPDGIYISLQMSDVEEFPLRYSLRHGLSCSAYRLWRRALTGSL